MKRHQDMICRVGIGGVGINVVTDRLPIEGANVEIGPVYAAVGRSPDSLLPAGSVGGPYELRINVIQRQSPDAPVKLVAVLAGIDLGPRAAPIGSFPDTLVARPNIDSS